MKVDKLTIGILAHVDAGKTTLSESILYLTGVTRTQGRVDHKNAFLDHDEIERNRGITVFAKEARFALGKKQAVLLDTPGHGDFSSEECIEYLKQADIVVTNPPFSLLREYVAQLMEYGKKFLINVY